MIINCPECNKEVSDQAATCPNCGVRIQTIEKTGQGWKLAQLTGILTIIAGIAYYCAYNNIDILICGVIMFTGGCIGSWWCRKPFKEFAVVIFKQGSTWNVIFGSGAVTMLVAYTVPIILLDSLISCIWSGYSGCIYSFYIKLICLIWIVFAMAIIPYGRKESERRDKENRRKKGGDK